MPPRHRLAVPLTVLAGGLLFALAWLRHLHFGSHAFDLGAYENLFFNLGARGTPYNAVERVHQWGNHFEVGLLWLYVPYRFAPSPAWLLALQAASVAACALPVEALARRATGDASRALLVSATVWLTPQLVFAHLYDFHALTVCSLPVALMTLELERDRARWVFGWALVCMSLREPMALAVAAAGPAWLLRHGRRRLPAALALVLMGVSVFLLQVLLIIPHYADGEGFRYVSQYGRLGGSPGDAVRFLVQHPIRFLGLAIEGGRPGYVMRLTCGAAPFAVLALWRRKTAWPLLIACPLLMVQLLNDRWEVWSIYFHYGSVLVPLVAMAGALALAEAPWPFVRRYGAWAWLGATAIYAIGWAITPKLFVETGPLDFRSRDARWQALNMVPDGDAVCAQQDLLPHLADRPVVHAWPNCDATDKFVVLDDTGMVIDRPVRPRITAAIQALRGDASGRVVFDRDGAFVFARP